MVNWCFGYLLGFRGNFQGVGTHIEIQWYMWGVQVTFGGQGVLLWGTIVGVLEYLGGV